MRSENGIPRPFQPNNLAQELRDLKRKVALLGAQRNFVSVERIVEGGTINENVGRQLTETVQETIVIDGGNLGEGALDGQRMVGAIIETNATANRGMKIDDTGMRGYDADGNRYMKADETGLEMTGSISTKGKTGEEVPRDIAVRLTTVARRPLGDGPAFANPSLVFVTDDDQLGTAPGIYSPDGKHLMIAANALDGTGFAVVDVGQGAVALTAGSITLSDMLGGGDISIGNTGFLGGRGANVNLLGNVKVNGNPIAGVTITEFTSTGSKANADATNQDIATPVPVVTGSNGTTATPAGTGTLTIPTAGIYGIDYQIAIGRATAGRTFIDISDANNKVFSRTGINAGEDQGTAVLGSKLFAAGERVKFRFYQSSGFTANYSATIRVTKYS